MRQPCEAFGWLEVRLLHDGTLARLGPEATAVLLLLALAADRHGASFYSRAAMSRRLGLPTDGVDRALRRLLEFRLVAHRPWRHGNPDGVWQLLPPPQAGSTATGTPKSLRDLLGQLAQPGAESA